MIKDVILELATSILEQCDRSSDQVLEYNDLIEHHNACFAEIQSLALAIRDEVNDE